MSQKNATTGYAVTLRHVPGSGFTVAVTTDAGERQENPAAFASLGHAFRLAQKTLVAAGFTVELNELAD